jgi:two-component system sensor histidine kinase/response regulator
MKDCSIKTRLFAVILLTSTVSLLVAGLLFVAFQSLKLKEEMRIGLALQTNVIADNAQAIIVFHDEQEAEKLLASLKHDQQIIAAFLLDKDKQMIGRYQRLINEPLIDTLPVEELKLEKAFYQETKAYAVYGKPVFSRGNKIGYVILYADFSRYREILTNFVLAVAIVVLIGLLVALLLSWILQKMISGPIESLAAFVSKVTADENYTLRIEDKSYVEIQQLGSAFNSLLDQIGKAISARDLAQEELKRYSLNLQYLVYARTRELEHAKEAAEASSRAKSAFLANMSHEIRTPMNAIICFTRLVLAGSESPRQKQQLNRVLESANLLLSLINDLLDLSRIDAEKMELDLIKCNLYEMLDEISQMLIARMEEKNLDFIIDVAETVPRYVIADSLRLKQILINLLTNAIKFTDTGHIRLSITAPETRRENRADLTFTVQDTGIGMDSKTLAKVFEVFTQGDVSTTRKYGGTGLGLSISKKLLELMNSHLIVDSAPGKGSSFSFSVSLECPLIKTASHLVPTHIPAILIVEPRQQSRDHLLALLQSLGCQAKSTDSVPSVLRLLSEQAFGYIFISLDLVGLEGSDLIETIRKDERFAQLSIVAITNPLAEQKIKYLTKEHYPLEFLTKPVYDREKLSQLLMADRIRSKAGSLTAAPTAPSAFKFSKALVVDDFDINRILVMDILQNEVEQFLEASNGSEAIEVLKKETVDLVLMDVQMPIMDGYHATEEIRKTLKLTEIPIIGMTAFAAENELNRCHQSGMNEVLTKPIEIDKFKNILEGLTHPRDLVQTSEKINTIELCGIKLPGIEVGKGLKNLRNDTEKYRALLLLFHKTYKDKFVELEQYIQNRQWEEAGNWVHAFKGVCANLYITELAEYCRRVEVLFTARSIDEKIMHTFKHQYEEVIKHLSKLSPTADKR